MKTDDTKRAIIFQSAKRPGQRSPDTMRVNSLHCIYYPNGDAHGYESNTGKRTETYAENGAFVEMCGKVMHYNCVVAYNGTPQKHSSWKPYFRVVSQSDTDKLNTMRAEMRALQVRYTKALRAAFKRGDAITDENVLDRLAESDLHNGVKIG